MLMKLNDIPDMDTDKFPERISVALSRESFAKLEALKKFKKKPSQVVRMLIDEFLKGIEFDEAS